MIPRESSRCAYPASRLRTGIGVAILMTLVAGLASGCSKNAPEARRASVAAENSSESAGAHGPASTPAPASTSAPTATPTLPLTPSLRDPASPWVLVTTTRELDPPSWVPPDLVSAQVPSANPPLVRSMVASSLTAMFAAAGRDGVRLVVQSAYRSFESQTRVLADATAREGAAEAARSTALPGRSEHQTGLAVDISAASGRCTLAECFGETAEGRWLAAHAPAFGFVLRYPRGAETVTGYRFEPWHVRWVGLELSTAIAMRDGMPLETYFGVSR